MNGTGCERRLRMVAGSESLISSSGASLLVRAAWLTGLKARLREQLGPWRADRSVHDPGKTVLDLAIAVALGGDCLADVGVLRAQPALFGPVASDPTVSRLIAALAAEPEAALVALQAARAAARAQAWGLDSPLAVDGPIVVDLDATIVIAHSEKEQAGPTWKRTFGFHPLLAFADHGGQGTGEPLAGMLRPGRSGANDADDHIAVLEAALAQIPPELRHRVLVRGDAGAGTRRFLAHLHQLGLSYSVGVNAQEPLKQALARVPRQAWRAALDGEGQPREGAQVAELTAHLDRRRRPWPPGLRVIARRERPHPGAQLRLTDQDGWRITMFATNVRGGRIAELELDHRRRARAEDRIRCLKDTGLRNLPLHDFAANQIWLEIVQIAADLLAWTQHLALHDTPARRWEPKRLRLRLFEVAGRIITTARARSLRISARWPWAEHLLAGHARLDALAATCRP